METLLAARLQSRLDTMPIVKVLKIDALSSLNYIVRKYNSEDHSSIVYCL